MSTVVAKLAAALGVAALLLAMAGCDSREGAETGYEQTQEMSGESKEMMHQEGEQTEQMEEKAQ